MPQEAILTAIIPVTNMKGRLIHFQSTITQCKDLRIKIVVVHDKRDSQTGPELEALLQKHGPPDAIFIEGSFGSAGRARNVGLNACRSKWVCFWDSDDSVYARNFLDMIKLAESNDCEIAIGRISVLSPEPHSLEVSSPTLTKHRNLDLQISNFPAFTRMGFVISALETDPFPEIPIGEDLIFLLRQEIPCKRVSISNDIVYCYRVGDPNQATNRNYDESLYLQLLLDMEIYLHASDSLLKRLNLAFADKLLFSLIRRGLTGNLTKKALNPLLRVAVRNLKSPGVALQILFYFVKNRPRVIRAIHGK